MKKKIKWIIIAALLLTGVFICIKRWKAWFGNPAEPAFTSITAPGRIQLTFGNDGEFSRNISWQCGDEMKPSFVAYVKEGTIDTTYENAEGKLFETLGGKTVIYHAPLKNLDEGAYSYNVNTGNLKSTWYQFTVNKSNEGFSFVYIGDIQDTINSVSKSFFTDIRRNHPADFWIFGGDVIERPHDRYWNEYFNSMDSISQTIPAIAAPGNHEYLKGVTRNLEERFIYTFSYLAHSQYKEHSVFSMNYKNATIITLDSNRDPWTLFSQRQWLKEALQNAQESEWIIVVLHHPIYSIRGKMNNLTVRTMFNGLIKKYNVDLVLQGHEHDYARMISKDENDEATTPIYLIGQSSPKDYKINFNKLYDRYGSGMRFYQTVDVQRDTLTLKTYTEQNNLYDNIQLVKQNNVIQITDMALDIPEHIEVNSRTGKLHGKKEEYKVEIEEWLNRK